ncbi:MAG: DUF2339 domain-containing protein [Candidatus Zixiibacteriota bacterium]
MSDSDDVKKLQETVERLGKKVAGLEKTLYDVTVYLQHQAKQESTGSSTKPLSKGDVPVIEQKHVETPLVGHKPDSESIQPTPQPLDSDSRPRTEKKSSAIPDYMKSSEFWLNKIGIGLILFSVVFAFKYSIDKGWITPPIRVVFGILVGLALCGFGFYTYKKRRHFALVLLGGGIASFYISDFAAFQMFQLITHPVAFGGMVCITILAYAISLRQDEPILSIIGVLGGLGTPFLLYTGQGNIPGLMLYTCLLIAASCAVYFFKGWRLLLIITVIGGWIVIFVAQINGLPVTKTEAIPDRWALQYGLISVWLLYWLVPLLREALAQIKPDTWAYPPLLMGGKPIAPEFKKAVDRYVHTLCLSTPVIVLGMSVTLWDYSDQTWGWVCLFASLLYGVVALLLYINKVKSDLVYTNGLIGLMLFTVSLSLVFDGPTSMITIGTEAFILFLIARRVNDKVIAAYSHVLFLILAGVVLARILLLYMIRHSSNSFFNKELIADSFVTGFIFAVGLMSTNIKIIRIYLIAGFLLISGILCRELSGNTHLFTLTLTGASIFVYLKYRYDAVIEKFGELYLATMLLWSYQRLVVLDPDGTAFFNAQALTDFALFAIAASIVVFIIENLQWKKILGAMLHVGILLFLYRELLNMPNYQGFITSAWGIYAIALMIIGLRKNYVIIRILALLTLFLVVAKLFLIDLSRIDAIWRVLLFLAFGGIFLLLSYYFRKLWKNDEDTDETQPIE